MFYLRQYLSRCLFVRMGLPKFDLQKLPTGKFMFYCLMALCIFVEWDSVVGIATRYGLEGRIPVGGQGPAQTSIGAHPSSCKMGTWSLSWG
jgi:hypothetical protein